MQERYLKNLKVTKFLQEKEDPVARALDGEFAKCAEEPKESLPPPEKPSAPSGSNVESPAVSQVSRQSSFAGVQDMLNRASTGDVAGISPPVPGIKPAVATYGITPPTTMPEVPAPSSPVPTSVRGGRTDAQKELHNRRMRFYRSLDSKGLSPGVVCTRTSTK